MPILTLHPDGAFDIAAGPVRLRRGFPALDHEAVRPLAVRVERDAGRERIVYDLAGGRTLELRFGRMDEALTLEAELTGFSSAPHWVHPVAEARLEGARRLFRTGVGFSGPTNFVDLAAQPDLYSFESYLFTGLSAADRTTLVIATRDVNDFMQKCHVENRIHRCQFRNREVDRNAASFEAGFSTERIPLPDGCLRLPALYFTAGADAWSGLREAAVQTAAAAGARPPAPPCYHYCSWYNRGAHFRHADVRALLDGLARDPEPIQAIQIDDGYERFYGDWLEPHRLRWPDGVRSAIADIVRHGYVPGIWVGPFMVGNRSRIATEHPDWLLHWADGSRVVEWRRYNGAFEEEEVYVLDTSHPDAMAYLAHVFGTLRAWGVRMFKTDFLEWGWKDSTRVRRYTSGKTATQYFRDVLRTIRGAIGEDSHWLGCITYFAPCIGFVDSMRVSSDVGVAWSGAAGGTGNDGTGGGTQNVVEESYGCQFLNNVLWQNDPDATFLRDTFIEMDEGEITSLALWNGITGGSINTSEDLHRLPLARRQLWRFLRPQAERWTARLPYWEGGSALKVAVRDYPGLNAWAVLLLNDSRVPVMERMRLRDWIGADRASVFEWGPGGAAPRGEREDWLAEVPGHRAVLLYLSQDGEAPPADLTLGGWRG